MTGAPEGCFPVSLQFPPEAAAADQAVRSPTLKASAKLSAVTCIFWLVALDPKAMTAVRKLLVPGTSRHISMILG